MKSIKFLNSKKIVKDCVPFKFNPRYMTEEQKEDLKKSMEKFDMAEVPVINLDNTIVAGHQRIKVLKEQGRENEEIDVRIPERLMTEKEVKEYCIRSNANHGEWSEEGLSEWYEKDDLKEWGKMDDWDDDNEEDFSDKNQEIDTDNFGNDLDIECPKCHFKFKK